MKIKQLLILGGVLLSSITANATIVDGVRQKPEPVTTPWTVTVVTNPETELPMNMVGSESAPYYLYNISAKLFFTQGNTWGTRGCVGPAASAVKVYFSEATDVQEAYYLNTFIYQKDSKAPNKYEWRMAVADAATQDVYTDQNAGWGRAEWLVVPREGNVIRLENTLPKVAGDGEHLYMGRDDEVAQNYYNSYSVFTDDSKRYPISAELDEGDGHHIDWALVTPADCEVYQAAMSLFEKAQELKALLDDAKEKGLNVEEEEKVYLNESSSMEALEVAIGTVQTKISNQLSGGATVDNPKDVTGVIQNPNFDNASADGWKGDTPNMVGSGSHGPANVAEHFNKTFDTYQELGHMAAGVYLLENQGFLRGWWDDYKNHTNYTAFLYAIADKDTMQVAMYNPFDVLNEEPMAGNTYFGTTAEEENADHDGTTYYVPTDPSAARLYFEKGYYKNQVFFAIEGDSVKLGVKKNVNREYEWAVFDSFKLTYFGNEPAAYSYWVNKQPRKEYKDVNVSEQYLTKYAETFNTPAANKSEVKAAIALIGAAEDSIAANIKLWKALKNKYDEGIVKCASFSYTKAAGKLGDYLSEVEDDTYITETELGTKTDDYDLSNQALQAMIDQINKLMDDVDTELKDLVKPGADVTMFIKNADFEKCAKDDNGNDIDNQAADWIVEKNTTQSDWSNVVRGGTSDNHCFEAWHNKNFDIYQEIKNLPVGLYEVSVKGYVRYLDGQDAITKAGEAPEEIAINLYINDVKTKFNNWLSNPQPASFYEGVATTEKDGGILDDGNDNCYPDNLKAASHAFANGCYEQTVQCFVAKEGSVTRIGVKGNLDKALYWVVFDDFKMKYIGANADDLKPVLQEKIEEAKLWESEMTTKSAKTAFTNAMTAANEAVNGDDAQAILTAVDNLTKAINAVKDGSQLCKPVQEEVAALVAFATESNSTLASDALTLAGTIQSGLEECTYDEEDLKAKSLEMKEMTLRMKLPVNYAEGSSEGLDVTAFIQTPSFEKKVDGAWTNSLDGWQGAADSKFGNDDDQKSARALEFYDRSFDMYQDVEGVGSIVLPNGYYKVTVNAFARTAENKAYFYAVSGDSKDEVALIGHEAGLQEGDEAPGDMISSVALFEKGRYLNEAVVQVSDNKLRIGIKLTKSGDTDWVIMDNFKLYFYGQDNTGVATVVDLGKPVQVQYFTLDGRRVNGVQKGITIRKTIMDNGSTVVRKIQK